MISRQSYWTKITNFKLKKEKLFLGKVNKCNYIFFYIFLSFLRRRDIRYIKTLFHFPSFSLSLEGNSVITTKLQRYRSQQFLSLFLPRQVTIIVFGIYNISRIFYTYILLIFIYIIIMPSHHVHLNNNHLITKDLLVPLLGNDIQLCVCLLTSV